MKEGWQILTIGETCQLVNGGTPKSGVSEYWGGNLPWITPAEMGKRQDPYIGSTQRTISELGLQNSSAKMIPPNSVILSSRAPIGHLAINSVPMAFNQGCKGLIPKSSIQHKFLYYCLLCNVEYLDSLGTGTTFKELSSGKLQEVKVPVPPLPEQQRIVTLLDEAFAGLATAKANAERNLRNARTVFESHLESVFNEEGEGWTESTIGAENRFIDYRGKTPTKTATGIPLITAKNIKMGFLQEEPKEFIAEGDYASWMTRGIPQKGDVLFTTEAPLANVAQLDTDEKVAFAQRVIIMQPDKSRLDSCFLKYLLLSKQVQDRIRHHGTGATVQGIKASLLKLIEISFPQSLARQESIVRRLDTLSEETQHLTHLYERKLAALEELKKSLLQQAFNGEL